MTNHHPNPLPKGEGAKTIVITGATGVLGTLTAKTFAAQGDSLALLDHNRNKLDVLTRDLNLPGERLFTSAIDLRNAQAVHDSAEAVAKKFGSVHALIHLIGGWTGGMLDQHAWTTFHLFQAFSDKLAASKSGRVIIVSKSTVSNPPGKEGIYAAAKAAQENLVLTLAAELTESDVTANVIQVKMIDVENKSKGTTPAEIVAAMQYLFSDEAAKITGTRIPLY